MKRPDWRYTIAQVHPNDKHSDPFIARLLDCYYNAKWTSDPEMHAVMKLYENYRLNISAMIVGGAANETIALCVGTIPEVIELYRKICFDINSDDPLFKKEKAIEHTTSPREKQVLLYSLTHGWEMFIRTCGKDGKILSEEYSNIITEDNLKKQALSLAQQKLAEQEISPISSPIYSNDGLLRVILNKSSDSIKEEDTDLARDVKKLIRQINVEDSRDKMEINNRDKISEDKKK